MFTGLHTRLDELRAHHAKRLEELWPLSKEAWERLSRLRLVKGETASNLELYLLQLYQSGKIKGEVSDSQMRQILELVSPKKEFKIRM